MLTYFLLDVFTYMVMVPILMTANPVLIMAWLAIMIVEFIVSYRNHSARKDEQRTQV